jgi:DNA-binding NtrC family response regulator
MNLGQRVLVVAPSARSSRSLAQFVRRAGYRPTVVTTFKAAKSLLASRPDLLVTELKLGEYNGLHLALRSRTLGVPAIVVADKTFEHEAEQVGAVWLSPEGAEGGELPAAMMRLLEAPADWLESTSSDATTDTTSFPQSSGFPGLVH